MQATSRDAPVPAGNPDEASEMAKYGITTVPVDYFHFGRFRYSTLSDAVAEAQRQRRQEGSR